ncbi:MAG: amino acid ABC transporter substrate-binding protein [Candidatus Dadabacteria bacterium]|nr:amino acid ABC transporter substrate-binding protein [Candidatus Dadabacteria bacterium]
MDKIVCGLSNPLSGRYAPQGREAFNGLSLWARDVNESGGVYLPGARKRAHIRLIHYDNRSEGEPTKLQVERLITHDGVDILIGPYSSGLTLEACGVADSHNKTLWNHGGSSDELFNRGYGCIVSAITSASGYFKGILDMISVVDTKSKALAVIYASDSGFSSEVAAGALRYGQEIGFQAEEFKYTSGESDFQCLLTHIKRFCPDVMLCAGRMDDDIALAKQILRNGVEAGAIGLVAAGVNDFHESLRHCAEGFIGPSQWEPRLDTETDIGPRSSEFESRYKDSYGRAPDYPAAQAYNIGLVIERCIAEAATLDGRMLKEAAGRLRFRTFYGDFGIDPLTGAQTAHRMVTVQWQGGKKLIIYPPEAATGDLIYPVNR